MLRIGFLLLVALIGGLLLSACGANPANGPVEVKVTLNEFSVESSVTEFKAGVPYHFVITNEGQIPHEFMIMPVEAEHASMPGMSMDEHHDIALLTISEDQLLAGGTVQADYTFESVPDEEMEIACRLAGHYEAGMHLPISFK